MIPMPIPGVSKEFIENILEGLAYTLIRQSVDKYNFIPSNSIECKVEDEQTVICWQFLQNCPRNINNFSFLLDEFSFIAKKVKQRHGYIFISRVYLGKDANTGMCYVLARSRWEPWGK